MNKNGPIKNYTSDELENLFLKQTPFIDVRSEGEFLRGSVPGAINLPILNDQERHQVGICYKQKGSGAAVELGHKIVCGENKEKKMKAWSEFIKIHPNTVLFCYRGGMRSQITQAWLKESGINIALIEGGHKKIREFFLNEFKNSQSLNYLTLGGLTGAGKTFILDEAAKNYAVIDLEALANHRGSAFGHYLSAQPTQMNFENNLSLSLLKMRLKRPSFIILEDESARIGQVTIPKIFFEKKKESPVFILDIPIEERALHIQKHYVETIWPSFLNTYSSNESGEKKGEKSSDHAYDQFFSFYANSFLRIQKHLGHLMYDEALLDLKDAIKIQMKKGDFSHHFVWIQKLLKYYYDPLYLRHWAKKQTTIIGKGNKQDFFNFLQSYRPCLKSDNK